MCFKIDKEICPEALIAKKDIRVYKLLENAHGSLRSPFKFLYYKPNTVYKTKFVIAEGYLNPHQDEISDGFHAYRDLKGVKKSIEEGYYWPSCLCEFIIPKGSAYYYNLDKGEIVSDQTYWTGRVWRTDRWIKWNGNFNDIINIVKNKNFNKK